MLTPNTLKTPFTLEGAGLHTGARCRVEVRPCACPGRSFVRDGVRIPALADYAVQSPRCTTLAHDDVSIGTVEHLLAALMLAGVDNAEIHVDGPEIPALDGCASRWYAEISTAGICPVEGEVPLLRVPEARWITLGDSDFLLAPAAEFCAYAAVAFPGTVAAHLMAGGPVAACCPQIVRARTFAREDEVRALLAAGLGQGVTLDTAVVLTADGYLNEHVWPREPAWHKVLDLVGDLALVGARIAGRVLAVRGGHRSHVALAKQLRGEWVMHIT